MPGFFETIERDDEAHRLARRLAGGCRRCEVALLPEARRQVHQETMAMSPFRRLLRRHRRHDPPADGNQDRRPAV